MLRITIEVTDDGTRVQLSGQMVGEWVVEVERVCTSAAPPLQIDATDLQGADAAGLALLAELFLN